MPFKKGKSKTGGKKAGTPNRTTKQAQEFFMFIMNKQVDRIESALTKINEDDPEKYINALSKLLQYYMPRKTDVTSGDEPIKIHLPDIIIK